MRSDLEGKPGPWIKSSRSGGAQNNCVEVRRSACRAASSVDVRDSKNPEGELLHFDRPAWADFADQVKAGRYGL